MRQKRWERIQELEIADGDFSEIETEVGPPYHFPKALEILGEGEVNLPVVWESLFKENHYHNIFDSKILKITCYYFVKILQIKFQKKNETPSAKNSGS